MLGNIKNMKSIENEETRTVPVLYGGYENRGRSRDRRSFRKNRNKSSSRFRRDGKFRERSSSGFHRNGNRISLKGNIRTEEIALKLKLKNIKRTLPTDFTEMGRRDIDQQVDFTKMEETKNPREPKKVASSSLTMRKVSLKMMFSTLARLILDAQNLLLDCPSCPSC